MREVELKEPVWAPPNTMMINKTINNSNNNDTNNNNNNNSNNKKKDRKEEKKRWLKDIHYMHRKKNPFKPYVLGLLLLLGLRRVDHLHKKVIDTFGNI